MNKSVLVCTMAASLLLGPAAAAGAAPRAAYPVGEVVSDAPLNVRQKATVHSGTVKVLRPGQRVLLNCQARGGWVDGNPVWYRLQGAKGWVAARFVHNHQPVRSC
ncbi:hypothetical protein [Streptomyces xanthophaeus]|uniref:SH3 domain-containing protein n=1 Tax=Streptomyces xanthophaeus TaxID=67385 RepID=A0A919GXA3_9ACTN|nr:hypothetical protein [Streptomyces xanthophaeus]WCD84399.1 hypothetical protein KPP03845_100722 [Streptomyces xanthophaeus]GHI83364.1 hypothetical protein Sxan_07280 [Streptomyces xanthophaeus]